MNRRRNLLPPYLAEGRPDRPERLVDLFFVYHQRWLEAQYVAVNSADSDEDTVLAANFPHLRGLFRSRRSRLVAYELDTDHKPSAAHITD